tara:strand:- start:520 stop:768 length:249 start_codon:yes stop_codon:yes gene_type:complete
MCRGVAGDCKNITIDLKNLIMRGELIQALKSHDWTYEYADDFSKYTRGKNQRVAINIMIQQATEEGWGDEAKLLYNEHKEKR